MSRERVKRAIPGTAGACSILAKPNTLGKIGIFFGTNSGTTRLIAKKSARLLGGVFGGNEIHFGALAFEGWQDWIKRMPWRT